jgi:hypothetical protein
MAAGSRGLPLRPKTGARLVIEVITESEIDAEIEGETEGKTQVGTGFFGTPQLYND